MLEHPPPVQLTSCSLVSNQELLLKLTVHLFISPQMGVWQVALCTFLTVWCSANQLPAHAPSHPAQLDSTPLVLAVLLLHWAGSGLNIQLSPYTSIINKHRVWIRKQSYRFNFLIY